MDRTGARQGLQDPSVGADPDRARLWERAGGLTPADHPDVPAVSTRLDAFAAIDHSLLGPPAFTEEYGDIALKVMSSWASLGLIWERGAWLILTSICVSVQGEIFRVGTYQQRPSALPVGLPVALPMALPVALPTPLPVTPPMAHEPMLLLAVTEVVANSAAFTYFTAGALHRNISRVGMAGEQSCPHWDVTKVYPCPSLLSPDPSLPSSSLTASLSS